MKKLTDEIVVAIKDVLGSDAVKEVIEATTKASDGDTGTFEMIITTENVDRYNEIVLMNGWELANYMQNAVVLWGHDHNVIVGMTTSLDVADGKMIAKGKFAPTEAGQEKRKLYDLGFLKAASVGFIEKERQGNIITKSELIEWSFVSVPANPYALTLAMEKGININELVTKGIFDIKEAPAETSAPVETKPEVASEDALAAKVADIVISKLKSEGVVLDAQAEPAPEHNDDAPAEPTEDEKALAEFAAKRKILQDAASIVGDVLAETRKAMQTRRN